MSQKLHVKKGDTVVVISGKEKGKQGEIIAVDIKKERVTVKGLNLVKRHTKPSQANPQGGIIEKEGTIHASNVMVLDPEQKVPTRTKKVEENGSLVRVAVKSGAKL
ncbi:MULTISPECIES: 50S ribosomal protein L24 [unclassified Veillonella]|uniref:50S ribosomal protein L24 n=1 Tax=unclassified Veillonella TaxID=2630086 RepID=UPI000F8E6C58|nr:MULTISPECIES: 50S ribosomal protein L24 [unclassified Veillonella]